MADVYRFIRDVYHGIDSYAVYSASGIEQGSQMQWDTGARVATSATLASGSVFLGVSLEKNPLASLGTSTNPLTGARLRIQSQGLFGFKATSGEVYSHLDPVYQGTDVQSVTNGASAGRVIGRVHLPDGTQVTGNGNNQVTVRIFGSMTNVSTVPSSATAAR